jgi:hypothetical protein
LARELPSQKKICADLSVQSCEVADLVFGKRAQATAVVEVEQVL